MRLLLIISTLLFISACDVAVDVDTGENKYCQPFVLSNIANDCYEGDRVTFFVHYYHIDQPTFDVSDLARNIAMNCDHRKEIVVTESNRPDFLSDSTLHSVNCVYKPAELRSFLDSPAYDEIIESQEAPFGKDEE
tara:strand:+ start:876 stop:1280 length:405 start_codon:yes stop_codon:yes gene_type:complete